jgi:purine nucleoside phosphorylase
MFLVIGGDIIVTSTVSKAIVARYINVKVFRFSVISDMGVSNAPRKITYGVEKRVVSFVKPKMAIIIRELIDGLSEVK